jgi:DNA modification methylase
VLTPVKGAKFDTNTGQWFTLAPRGDYTDESIARLEKENRVYRSPTGKVYIKYWLVIDKDGNAQKPQPVDSIWNDISPLRHASPKERTGYPTQKPVALLKRIIECGTQPGGLVFDPFAGSGTTLVAAAELGRKAIGCDIGILARSTIQDRMSGVNPQGLRIDTLVK